MARHSAEILGEKYEELTETMVTGEIGDVIIGKTVGRLNDEEKVLSVAVGMSIEDIIVARAAYEAAIEKNIGLILPFQDI
jgi:ornithine cyclodeaminase